MKRLKSSLRTLKSGLLLLKISLEVIILLMVLNNWAKPVKSCNSVSPYGPQSPVQLLEEQKQLETDNFSAED